MATRWTTANPPVTTSRRRCRGGAPRVPGPYEPAIRESFGARAEAVLAEYPVESFADDTEAWSAVRTDRTFACPRSHANDVMSEKHRRPRPRVRRPRRAGPAAAPRRRAPKPGAAHSAELPHLFDMASQPLDIEGNHVPLTPAQRGTASRVIEVWAGFARTGRAPVAPWTPGGRSLVFGAEDVTTGTRSRPATATSGRWSRSPPAEAGIEVVASLSPAPVRRPQRVRGGQGRR
ncbi:hypothetical protein C1701_20490 [Actinoalloteichus sp. AHMU CJ021]|uniref:hypothetical protein n=1 Tax=Actinoalloteichus TaxID=65496 RepID=UPI000CA00A86|nr:hypothetical protein C1701_20490 [Actinoalloteichus sp. AHMU CJ021]